jgi:SET and MYND domain-containing protein
VVCAPGAGQPALLAGHVVCMAPALAVSVVEEWKKRVCASCFGVGAGRLEWHCATCDQAYYCSAACQATHLAAGGPAAAPHAALCPALRQFARLKRFGKSDVAMFRLILELLWRASAAGPGGGDFERLQWHPWAAVRPEKERVDWTKACAVFSGAVAACGWCGWSAAAGGAAPTERRLHEMLSRIDSNCFGCYSADGRLVGHGVYPAAALFNHSCEPNCVVGLGGLAGLEVSTAEPVAAGTDLCISYIDTNAPLAARRRRLAAQYNFDCRCPRCEDEAGAPAWDRARISYQGRARNGQALGARAGGASRGPCCHSSSTYFRF